MGVSEQVKNNCTTGYHTNYGMVIVSAQIPLVDGVFGYELQLVCVLCVGTVSPTWTCFQLIRALYPL